jgi:hypothetical protein
VLAGVLSLAACGDSGIATRQPEVPNDGIQMSGRVGGAQLSVSFGDPDFLITDCDVDDGLDGDWCLVARSIDGARVQIVFENPIVFTAGAVLDVDLSSCRGCDDVTTAAIVDVRVGDKAKRAIAGTVRVIEVGPRYAMTFTLRFDDGGTLAGEFNVRPLGAVVPVEEQTLFDSEA